MDNPQERTITITVDGAGALHWNHSGLSPIEIMGILSMVSHFAMDDLALREASEPAAKTLLDHLKAMRGN